MNKDKDIVILNVAFAPLPADALQVMLGLNYHFRQSDEIVFGDDGSVPHLTAIMMPADVGKLPLIYQMVATIVGMYQPLEVSFGEFYANEIVTGQLVAGVAIRKTPKLVEFHAHLVNSLRPLAAPFEDLRPGMLFSDRSWPAPTQMSVGFATSNATQLFEDPSSWFPHITSHVGPKPTGYTIPFQNFSVDTLSVFHLGVYGTCKKLLESFPLGGGTASMKKS
ncbi:MAG: hypothetical protein A3F54_01575 [Candidatus Kerfeldbacteria bacterium RIFCSPHIGHO2_12_FULL_48_17]|uniref:2'-5' RNA ligase n=1 Tax=Candidatus Kerfeldbacteria bacterium RIFCSPHIGHO2_12_FULL_48_17 TaxID=1798542 RepID=A0A1G2B7Z3_9BACT|nr:MAG: hypothetical protein A3F54_01575 [Candidatus Kerfeldbacteria bacterium RIFCSPHIGHO2_12_FULL_48_17]